MMETEKEPDEQMDRIVRQNPPTSLYRLPDETDAEFRIRVAKQLDRGRR